MEVKHKGLGGPTWYTHTPPYSSGLSSSFMPSGLLHLSHAGFLLILEHVRSPAASAPWHWLFPLPGCPPPTARHPYGSAPHPGLYPSDTSQWGLPWASYVEVRPPLKYFQSPFLFIFLIITNILYNLLTYFTSPIRRCAPWEQRLLSVLFTAGFLALRIVPSA